MISVIRRGLFWRVYLTLLGGLVLVAVLAATLWHAVAERPMAGVMSYPGAALGALFPAANVPKSRTDEALRKLSAALDTQIMLVDAGGRVIGVAGRGHILTPDPSSAKLARGGMPRVWRARLPQQRTLIVESRGRFGGPHILAMLLSIAAAVGIAAYPVVSRLTRRLERLKSSLDAWGGGTLSRRAEVEGRDEIAAVATSFNIAADRVEALLAAHKALLAHASHELRSPLTRLRLAVEMFAASPDAALRPAIVADIAELDGLVEEILLASRLDHTPGLTEREAVDLLGLVAEEAARAGADVLGVEESGPYEVVGSPRLLRRMIRNLIENAAKHGRPPVEVELTRSADRTRITVVVHDRGAGIADAERERVFEPFYRPSGRAEAAGSWGLGLSIVRQIAERHGGEVSCRVGPSGGGAFIAVLPAADG